MDQANQAPCDQARRLKMARTRAQLVEGRRDWFRITNLGNDRAELFVYDEIGYFGVSAADLMEQLSALKVANLSVRLSSPGGDVFDGIAIHNALRSHPARVTVQVDSIAASIASVIAMAGDEIVMAPHSELMIHEASGVAVGDAATMREMADLLDRQSDKIAKVYAERAGGQYPSWRKRMRAETWYSAAEAVAAGLADRVADLPRQQAEVEPEEPVEDAPMMAASWDLSIFRYPGRQSAPDPITNQAETEPEPAVEQPDPEPVPDGQEQPGEGADVEPETVPAEAPAPENPAPEQAPAPDDGQAPDPDPAPAAEAGPAPEPDPAPDPVPTEQVPGPAPVNDWATATASLTTGDDWNTLVANLTSDNAVFARLRENLF